MIYFEELNNDYLDSVLNILGHHEELSKNNFERFGLRWSEDQVRQALTNDMCFGLFDDSELVAFILGRKLNEQTYEIDMTMTDPMRLKKGLMAKLLMESIGYLKGRSGLDEVWLEVHEENIPAINFYKKMGFVQNTTRPQYYPDKKAAILMTLKTYTLN